MLLPFSAVKAEIGTKGRLIRRASASDADLSEGDCRGAIASLGRIDIDSRLCAAVRDWEQVYLRRRPMPRSNSRAQRNVHPWPCLH